MLFVLGCLGVGLLAFALFYKPEEHGSHIDWDRMTSEFNVDECECDKCTATGNAKNVFGAYDGEVAKVISKRCRTWFKPSGK